MLVQAVRFVRTVHNFPAFLSLSVVGWLFKRHVERKEVCMGGSNRLMGPRTEMRQIRPVSLQGGN